MKTKVTILLALVAIITLSFTFSSATKPEKKAEAVSTQQDTSEPVGGFVSEDKF